jgi:hypothetical protein
MKELIEDLSTNFCWIISECPVYAIELATINRSGIANRQFGLKGLVKWLNNTDKCDFLSATELLVGLLYFPNSTFEKELENYKLAIRNSRFKLFDFAAYKGTHLGRLLLLALNHRDVNINAHFMSKSNLDYSNKLLMSLPDRQQTHTNTDAVAALFKAVNGQEHKVEKVSWGFFLCALKKIKPKFKTILKTGAINNMANRFVNRKHGCHSDFVGEYFFMPEVILRDFLHPNLL